MADEKPILAGAPTTPADSPEASAVRAEVAAIMQTPDYHRRTDLQAKVESLYRQKYGDAQVPLGQGITVGEAIPAPPVSDTVQADAAFVGEIRTQLAEQLGASGVSHAQAGWQRFFQGVEDTVIDRVEDRMLGGLSPSAEKQAHVEVGKFLSDMEGLFRQPGMSEPGGDAARVAEGFGDALQREYGVAADAVHRDCQIIARDLFHVVGGARVSAAIEQRIASLPPSARVQAQLRVVRFLHRLGQLRQSQS